jgi:hypothetical protein
MEVFLMRRIQSVFGLLLLVAALTGCARQQESATETTTDSLLATSPIEQPQGDLTPQEQFEPEPEPQAPPVQQPRAKTPAPSRPRAKTPTPPPAQEPAGVTLAAGTPISVSVSTEVSSETAQVGDAWTGEVTENVIVGNEVVIPAGSTVHGVVNAARPAQKGTLALLDLAVRSVSVGGKTINVSAATEAIEAGSPRARNLGAIAGGAAAGALIGKAVGGSGKGAVIGGLIGGAAAGAGVAASKGYQVKLKEGTVLTFSVSENVTVRS